MERSMSCQWDTEVKRSLLMAQSLPSEAALWTRDGTVYRSTPCLSSSMEWTLSASVWVEVARGTGMGLRARTSFDGWARDTCTYVRMDAQGEVWIDWILYERSLVQWSWTCSDSRHVGRTKLPLFERGMDRADWLASPQHGPS
jgi:hypothetical protein